MSSDDRSGDGDSTVLDGLDIPGIPVSAPRCAALVAATSTAFFVLWCLAMWLRSVPAGRSAGIVLMLALALFGPTLVVVAHYRWQPRRPASAALALGTGVVSLLLAFALVAAIGSMS
ncbi:MAG: hypothetical protein JNK78_05835 [Planctomycetes bacterium]|nr:hypothetical protein [Planctomycetota bacterium]